MFITKKSQKIMIIIMLMSLIFSIFPILNAKAIGPLDGFNFTYEVDSGNKASFGVNVTGEHNALVKDSDFVNKSYSSLKSIIFGIFGVSSLTMVVLFIINFTKLGTAASSPQERSQAIRTLLFLGIAAAMLGGVTLFVGFSTNLLK